MDIRSKSYGEHTACKGPRSSTQRSITDDAILTQAVDSDGFFVDHRYVYHNRCYKLRTFRLEHIPNRRPSMAVSLYGGQPVANDVHIRIYQGPAVAILRLLCGTSGNYSLLVLSR